MGWSKNQLEKPTLILKTNSILTPNWKFNSVKPLKFRLTIGLFALTGNTLTQWLVALTTIIFGSSIENLICQRISTRLFIKIFKRTVSQLKNLKEQFNDCISLLFHALLTFQAIREVQSVYFLYIKYLYFYEFYSQSLMGEK
jgi:hypothetical protein